MSENRVSPLTKFKDLVTRTTRRQTRATPAFIDVPFVQERIFTDADRSLDLDSALREILERQELWDGVDRQHSKPVVLAGTEDFPILTAQRNAVTLYTETQEEPMVFQLRQTNDNVGNFKDSSGMALINYSVTEGDTPIAIPLSDYYGGPDFDILIGDDLRRNAALAEYQAHYKITSWEDLNDSTVRRYYPNYGNYKGPRTFFRE